MTRDAAHGSKAVDQRPGSRRFGRFAATALTLSLGLAPAFAMEAAAQSRSGITINDDVLNSLGPGPEAAPLAPLAPAAPPTQVRAQELPAYQAPAAAPASDGSSAQPYGDGGLLVTRPGTLLFPPLQEPTSTLTPGFAGEADNHAARARALDNAFAEGPEPRSQLLIPPAPTTAGNDSVIVFMDALPPADPDADPADAPKLVLRQPPQPAPRKPAVPDTALARLQQPGVAEEPATLAPEFAEPETPVVAELPPPETTPETMPEALPETMPEALPEAMAPQSPPATAGLAAAELGSDGTPAPMQPEAAAPAPAETVPPAGNAQAAAPTEVAEAAAPAARSEVASSAVEPATAATAPDAPPPAGPVSLLPAVPAALQTASLTVGGVDDTSLLFEVDSSELSSEAELELRSLAAALRHEADGEIQVLGFASGQDGAEDQARKLALSRALKVRSFLIDEGIASARIRVRSLGDRAEGGPANRVDIKPIGS